MRELTSLGPGHDHHCGSSARGGRHEALRASAQRAWPPGQPLSVRAAAGPQQAQASLAAV